MADPKKTKTPKIVQITNDNNGIASVLCSDGRVFLWKWDNEKKLGYWGELSVAHTPSH